MLKYQHLSSRDYLVSEPPSRRHNHFLVVERTLHALLSLKGPQIIDYIRAGSLLASRRLEAKLTSC